MEYHLPPDVARFINGAPMTPDEVGESPCSVYRFRKGGDTFFLKVSLRVYAPTTYSALREAQVLDWLSGRLNVPEVAVVAAGTDCECLITRRVPGRPLYELIDAQQPVLGCFRVALGQVQGVSIQNCPFHSGAALRVQELAYLMAHGLTADDADLSQWPGIRSQQDLLAYLWAHLPDEDSVFSHGDLGDSNIFVDEARDELHYIDLGRAGIADRWLDITFVHRNLREECSPQEADQFLASLPLPDAPGKRQYFELLDELF
jgi:kanamycin kinase